MCAQCGWDRRSDQQCLSSLALFTLCIVHLLFRICVSSHCLSALLKNDVSLDEPLHLKSAYVAHSVHMFCRKWVWLRCLYTLLKKDASWDEALYFKSVYLVDIVTMLCRKCVFLHCLWILWKNKNASFDAARYFKSAWCWSKTKVYNTLWFTLTCRHSQLLKLVQIPLQGNPYIKRASLNHTNLATITNSARSYLQSWS